MSMGRRRRRTLLSLFVSLSSPSPATRSPTLLAFSGTSQLSRAISNSKGKEGKSNRGVQQSSDQSKKTMLFVSLFVFFFKK